MLVTVFSLVVANIIVLAARVTLLPTELGLVVFGMLI